MRRLLLLLGCSLLLLAPAAAPAGDGKLNTLSARDAAEGWLLLFDGKTPFGWNVEGQAAVEKDALALGGKTATTAALATRFSSFELRLEFRCEGAKKASLLLQRGDSVERHSLLPGPANNMGWDRLTLQVEYDPAQKKETTHLHSVSASGDTTLNAKGTAQGGTGGPMRLRIETPAGTKVLLRNARLRPAGMKSIFNGRDLGGWKVFPGKKSKFTVNAKGELNVKDGPGDLQTEGKWADFVLQLECVSNGKHLNSGIFFRCRAGEYQNGYEAQIRNQFTAEPTQQYTLEEYDPTTHQLAGKKKIQSTAVDYGTGAIYRRMPARLGIAKDGEWFTLTVVADGKHLATWVNGIQVVDWVDNRPPNANARTGCCLNAGHISLQGHDPTTDLSFRNFRLAELPREER